MKHFFRKIRFSLRFLSAFWQKHKKLLIFSTLVGVLSFLFFLKFSKLFLTKKTERIGLVGRFTINELPLEIQTLISQGLTSLTPDDQVGPALATSWEINKEGKEYLFILKENVFWQDGKPVLAKDINYHFSDVTARALDDKRIKFELKEPFSPFPAIVSRPVFKKGLLGTGEYKVKRIKKNGQIVEKIVLIPTKNKAKSHLIFRFYPTEEAARIAFKLGEIDLLRGISQIRELEKWEMVKIEPEVKFNRFVAVFFNTRNHHLANKSVRQALAYAIQKRWQPRALNSINPQSWAFNPTVKKYEFNLEKAKKLFKKGESEEEVLKEIELATVPLLLQVAEEIKNDWEKLGITTKIKVISSLEEVSQALLISQEVAADPDQYVLWHSTQASNISHYKSPKIDKLLEDGRKTLDQKERKKIYHDFQRFLVEDSPAVFLFHPTLYTVSRK